MPVICVDSQQLGNTTIVDSITQKKQEEGNVYHNKWKATSQRIAP